VVAVDDGDGAGDGVSDGVGDGNSNDDDHDNKNDGKDLTAVVYMMITIMIRMTRVLK
jgi:hypothetical protein